MPGLVLIETQDEFDAKIESSDPSFFFFCGPQCGPCQKITPHVESLAQTAKFPMFKVDISKTPEAAGDAGVTKLPTFQIWKENELLYAFEGASKEDVSGMVAHVNRSIAAPNRMLTRSQTR